MKLFEIYNELSEDTGASGKEFEQFFIQALHMSDLEFEINRSSGSLWDIHPTEGDWTRILDDRDVNVKVARTKWLFGSALFGTILPWNDIGEDWDEIKYGKRVKRAINKLGVSDVLFLKPKDETIQNKIIAAVQKKDVNTLNTILTKNNFIAEKLGNNYDVRILTRNNYITSIVLIKSGKVFARAERPRQVGGSATFVGFKADNPQMSKIVRKVKDPV